MEKSKKILKIVAVLLISLVVYRLLEHDQYVKLLDAIKDHDNQKVERILKWNWFDLDKQSGHFPWAWLSGFDEHNSPLELACREGNNQVAKMLIDKGADVSIQHEGSYSLLYLTMTYTELDDYELIKILIEHGAEPKGAPKNDYKSSLETCANMSCGDKTNADGILHYNQNKAIMIFDIYRYLQKSINKEDNVFVQDTGITPLHSAVGSQNLVLIEYLIDEGEYHVNDRDKDGQTSIFFLLYAIEENGRYDKKWKRQTLDLLIRYGADPTIEDNQGKTVYDCAVENGDDYLAGLLKQYMEKRDQNE